MSRTFNCAGKVNINDYSLNNSSLFLQKEVENVLEDKKLCIPFVFKRFNSEPSGIHVLMNLKDYVKYVLLQLRFFERHESVFYGNEDKQFDFFSVREEICAFLLLVRDVLLSLKKENFTLQEINNDVEKDFIDLIQSLHRFLNSLQNIKDSTFLIAAQSIGNKCNQFEYHQYHIHLDLRWLKITLLYVRGSLNPSPEFYNEELEDYIYLAIKDIIHISLKVFQNTKFEELKIKTPYSCTCLRELYLMLQVFTDNLCHKYNFKKNFWNYIHSILNDSSEIDHCKSPELFRLWLTYHLILLNGYNENGMYHRTPSEKFTSLTSNTNQIEKILKNFVNKGGKEGVRDSIDLELTLIIQFLYELSSIWCCRLNIQIISYLYDCFHRRLDLPFLSQNRGPWVTPTEKKTPMDILKEVRDRLEKDLKESGHTSFGLFLKLLGTFLHFNDDQKIRNQMKSRINSRFTENKIKELSETGIYNFISLYLTMAITTDISVCNTMMKLLPSTLELTETTFKKSSLIWKSQLIVLILYHEQDLSYEEISESFIKTVNIVSCRKDNFSREIMTWYIDVIRIILIQSTYFDKFEHKFLDGWIDRYLTEISVNKCEILIYTLLEVFNKCNELSNDINGKSLMLFSLWKHLSTRMRLLLTYCDPVSNFYQNSTKLAVAFTVDACKNPENAKKFSHSAASLFLHFTSSPIIKDIRISRLFLSIILKNNDAVEHLKAKIKNFNISCIQSYVKCSILSIEKNDEIDFLKQYISSLPEIRQKILTSSEVHEFLKNDEPIIYFFTVICKRRNSITSEEERGNFDDFCRQFFINADKWAFQGISNENKKTDLSTWIYKCIGTIILRCSPILYSQNPTKNIFKSLIFKTALQKEEFSVYLTQKIFSNILLGIENLDVKSDISLVNTIRELFEKYLPILVMCEAGNSIKVSDSLSHCFFKAKPQFINTMLEILTSNFITTPNFNTTHKNCYLVMFLIRYIVKNNGFPLHIIETIITTCIPSIIRCYLKLADHPHKVHTMDILRDISLNMQYKKNFLLREKLEKIAWSILKDNIITYSKTAFDFLTRVHRANLNLFESLLPLFREKVAESERNKVPGAANLKYLLEDTLKIIKLNKS